MPYTYNHSAERARLTRAVKTGLPENVIAACRHAVKQWDDTGIWPDDWHRWESALLDARLSLQFTTLENL